MVKIECLVCRAAIKIPKFIDTERYDGQVACQNCNSLLHIKLVQAKVQVYKVVTRNSELRTPTADELEKALRPVMEAQQQMIEENRRNVTEDKKGNSGRES